MDGFFRRGFEKRARNLIHSKQEFSIGDGGRMCQSWDFTF